MEGPSGQKEATASRTSQCRMAVKLLRPGHYGQCMVSHDSRTPNSVYPACQNITYYLSPERGNSNQSLGAYVDGLQAASAGHPHDSHSAFWCKYPCCMVSLEKTSTDAPTTIKLAA